MKIWNKKHLALLVSGLLLCGCNSSDVEVKNAHNMVKVNEVPATCYSAGVKEHYVCSDDACAGVMYKDEEGKELVTSYDLIIPKTKHNYTITEVIPNNEKNPTKLAAKLVCSNQGCTSEIEGHEFVTSEVSCSLDKTDPEYVACSCNDLSKNGTNVYVADFGEYGKGKYKVNVVPAHNFNSIVVENSLSKTTYVSGEKIDLSGLDIYVVCATNSSHKISVTPDELEVIYDGGRDKLTTLDTKVTLRYYADDNLTYELGGFSVTKAENSIKGLEDKVLNCGDIFNANTIYSEQGSVDVSVYDKNSQLVTGTNNVYQLPIENQPYTIKAEVEGTSEYDGVEETTATISVSHSFKTSGTCKCGLEAVSKLEYDLTKKQFITDNVEGLKADFVKGATFTTLDKQPLDFSNYISGQKVSVLATKNEESAVVDCFLVDYLYTANDVTKALAVKDKDVYGYFKLANDIVNEYVDPIYSKTDLGFSSQNGENEHGFYATFDGNGHTVNFRLAKDGFDNIGFTCTSRYKNTEAQALFKDLTINFFYPYCYFYGRPFGYSISGCRFENFTIKTESISFYSDARTQTLIAASDGGGNEFKNCTFITGDLSNAYLFNSVSAKTTTYEGCKFIGPENGKVYKDFTAEFDDSEMLYVNQFQSKTVEVDELNYEGTFGYTAGNKTVLSSGYPAGGEGKVECFDTWKNMNGQKITFKTPIDYSDYVTRKLILKVFVESTSTADNCTLEISDSSVSTRVTSPANYVTQKVKLNAWDYIVVDSSLVTKEGKINGVNLVVEDFGGNDGKLYIDYMAVSRFLRPIANNSITENTTFDADKALAKETRVLAYNSFDTLCAAPSIESRNMIDSADAPSGATNKVMKIDLGKSKAVDVIFNETMKIYNAKSITIRMYVDRAEKEKTNTLLWYPDYLYDYTTNIGGNGTPIATESWVDYKFDKYTNNRVMVSEMFEGFALANNGQTDLTIYIDSFTFNF